MRAFGIIVLSVFLAGCSHTSSHVSDTQEIGSQVREAASECKRREDAREFVKISDFAECLNRAERPLRGFRAFSASDWDTFFAKRMLLAERADSNEITVAEYNLRVSQARGRIFDRAREQRNEDLRIRAIERSNRVTCTQFGGVVRCR